MVMVVAVVVERRESHLVKKTKGRMEFDDCPMRMELGVRCTPSMSNVNRIELRKLQESVPTFENRRKVKGT